MSPPSAFGDPDFKDLDLRQQLARAIYNRTWGKPAYAEAALPAPVDSNPHSAPWLAAADECLRQMEWTRAKCRACVGGAAEDTDDCIVEMPLTLAPEDWKP